MAEATKTGMSMHYLDLFSENDIAEYREEREDGGKCGFTVNDQKRDVIDFETIGQVAYSCTTLVGMSDDDDFVTAVDQFSRQLVNVTFDSSWLREKEVADHSDIVRHLDIVIDSIVRYLEMAGKVQRCGERILEMEVGSFAA